MDRLSVINKIFLPSALLQATVKNKFPNKIQQMTTSMKINSVLLFAVFSLMASAVSANDIVSKDMIDTKISTEKKDNREDIHSFEYDKLFAEAQKLHKAAKSWEKIKCEPKKGFICTKHECNKYDSKANLVLDKKNGTITRCEGKNCETFEAEFEQTGVYINIQSKGPVGTLIRVLGDYRYKEITTVALDAYIANGECSLVTK